MLDLPFREDMTRPARDNAIDLYISEDCDDVLDDGAWQVLFTDRPPELTPAKRKEWISNVTGVALGSDAFFPFGDNIERANRSGVKYIVQPGGSIRDDNVIKTCNKYEMVMALTGLRLFCH